MRARRREYLGIGADNRLSERFRLFQAKDSQNQHGLRDYLLKLPMPREKPAQREG